METDYLVIGAGAMGLAFADELFTRTDAHITLVDKRHAPGGHWNDAYSFVRLHQPSVFYGVESKELGDYRIDEHGPNRGLLTLAPGSQVISYFHELVRDRFLPSGRVRFLPLHEVAADGGLRALLSREHRSITVRKKVVDASFLTNAIPKTHARRFEVAAGVSCVPPNDLPQLAAAFERFTVIGAGKTGMDACGWLLEHGARPEAIRWIVPRDSWLVNRATAQPGREFFLQTFGGFAAAREALASATSARDFAQRMEAGGVWLRLDPKVEPRMFHGASIAENELAELRRIDDVVRLGRVRALEPKRIVLEHGELAAEPNTLYIDCTAAAFVRPDPKPVFAADRITLQMVRYPQLPFSAALIGFIEATLRNDADKNACVVPVRIPDTVEEYIAQFEPDLRNREACNRHPEVRAFIGASRLEGFTRVMRAVKPEESEQQAVIARLRDASKRAAENLPRLLEALR